MDPENQNKIPEKFEEILTSFNKLVFIKTIRPELFV